MVQDLFDAKTSDLGVHICGHPPFLMSWSLVLFVVHDCQSIRYSYAVYDQCLCVFSPCQSYALPLQNAISSVALLQVMSTQVRVVQITEVIAVWAGKKDLSNFTARKVDLGPVAIPGWSGQQLGCGLEGQETCDSHCEELSAEV